MRTLIAQKILNGIALTNEEKERINKLRALIQFEARVKDASAVRSINKLLYETGICRPTFYQRFIMAFNKKLSRVKNRLRRFFGMLRQKKHVITNNFGS